MSRRVPHLRQIGAGVLAAACVVCTGCQRPLFSERDVRSPYDRYDIVRDSSSPPFLRDEFGRKLPNLRGRLLRAP